MSFPLATAGHSSAGLLEPTTCPDHSHTVPKTAEKLGGCLGWKGGMAIATSLVIQPREGFVQVGEESSCSLDTLIMQETDSSKQR